MAVPNLQRQVLWSGAFEAHQGVHGMSDVEENELVTRAREGDQYAFRELACRYHERIFNTVYALVGNRDDADDLTQEIFLKAYRSLSGFQGRSQFYTWLYRIGVNCWKDWLKSPKHLGHREDLREYGEEDESAGGQSPHLPDARVESRELQHLLEQALGALPAEQRATVVLREIDGLDYKEIARVMGCSLGTVKSRLCRARVRLKALWETQYREYWEGRF